MWLMFLAFSLIWGVAFYFSRRYADFLVAGGCIFFIGISLVILIFKMMIYFGKLYKIDIWNWPLACWMPLSAILAISMLILGMRKIVIWRDAYIKIHPEEKNALGPKYN